jgi:hypothetical protein
VPGWFYYPDRGRGNRPVGPIALEELVRRIKAHSLAETTLVFAEGTDYAYDAYTFPPVARRLPLALPELTRAWGPWILPAEVAPARLVGMGEGVPTRSSRAC